MQPDTSDRYIEMNPVRAGMTDSPEGYRWSSFHHNALGHPNNLVVPHEAYRALGEGKEEQRRAYGALFDHELKEREMTAIREGTEKGEVIGSKQFQEEMAGMLKRRVTRMGYGGDRMSMAYRGGGIRNRIKHSDPSSCFRSFCFPDFAAYRGLPGGVFSCAAD